MLSALASTACSAVGGGAQMPPAIILGGSHPAKNTSANTHAAHAERWCNHFHARSRRVAQSAVITRPSWRR